jgi:hypothetical protein
LDELKTAIEAFVASDPYTITPHEEAETNAIRYRVVFEQPKVHIFLIAGDVFQCLRTALDQAMWSLAALKHADPEWTQFPIFSEDTAKIRKRFNAQTLGIREKAIAIIESLQPYRRPAGTPLSASLLWQLHEINRSRNTEEFRCV